MAAKKGSARCLGCMTTLTGDQETCPRCGYSKKSEYDADFLRPGKTLADGRYIAGKLVRRNGESAYYVGYDKQENRACWIREYFPTKLSRRVRSKGIVTPLDGAEAQYKALLSDFMDVCNEVKRLGVTENVIRILATFNDNNTVYAVYDTMALVSFDEYLAKNGGKLPLNRALDLLLPLCNMVATIHDHGHIHRGISPHTVYVDKNDTLYLWDFSIAAARTAGSELEAELFNGYSAPEQYVPNGWQGTWTDIYALAALLYRSVSGFVPPKSTFVGDDRHMAPLSDLVLDMPQSVSDAVADAMLPTAEKRTSAVYKFTAALLESDSDSTAVYDAGKIKPEPERYEPVRERDSGGFKYAILALAITVLLLVGGLWYLMKTYFPDMVNEPDRRTSSSSQATSVPEVDDEPDADADEDTPAQSGEIDTPRFVGQMLSAIQSDSYYQDNFDFKIEEEFNSDFPAGVVFRQMPPADAAIAAGSTVTLYVSKGVDEIATLPNIIGLDYEEALAVLRELEIPSNKVERRATGAVAGSVVGTSPPPGTKIGSSDIVTIYVMPAQAE